MKILIFSWRDIKHPQAGGAEIVDFQLAQRWVKKGHPTTIVSARFPGAQPKQKIHNIQIIRPAPFYRHSLSQYLNFLFQTYRYYKNHLQGQYDLVIDEIHGFPLFTTFYAREKVILYPHEVAHDIWQHQIPFPYSHLGYLIEKLYIKLTKNTPFITVSPSTAQDLASLGVKNIHTFTSGSNITPLKKLPQKTPHPTLINLGRIIPMKQTDHTLKAFKIINQKYPQSQLYLAGSTNPQYLDKLKNLTHTLKLNKNVIFTGFISEKEKVKLLSQSWLLISTSIREGWGLVVVEAAACGTPACTYRVPGFKDVIKASQTGILTSQNSPHILAHKTLKILQNQKLLHKLSQNALAYSRHFNWDKTATHTLKILQKIVSP